MLKSRAETAKFLHERASWYLGKQRHAVAHELTLGERRGLRADVLGINTKKEITIIEVKSCKQDFDSDKKLLNYLSYCTRFYICVACPELAEHVKQQTPKEVGVMLVEPTGTRAKATPRVVRPARKRKVEEAHVDKILMRMVFRNADYTRLKARRKS